MLRIIHMIPDDKFIEAMITQFNTVKGINCRYIINNRNREFRYIKNTEAVESISGQSLVSEINKSQNYDVLILHTLYSIPLEILPEISKKVKIVWFSWGFDIYLNSQYNYKIKDLVKISLYKPETKNILEDKISLKGKVKKILAAPDEINAYYSKSLEQRSFESSISRIDYCSTIIPMEYDLLKKHKFFRAKQVFYSYPFDTHNFSLKLFKEYYKKSNNILIGNSADPSNNHVDIFRKLRKISLNEKNMEIPLSYGDDSPYSQKVMEIGKSQFGEKIRFLTEYLSFEEYFELIGNCSYSVFYHSRQQALGTILLSIFSGGKIFLSRKNVVFKFLKSKGVVVYSIENDLTQKELDTVLPYKIALNNFNLMFEYYNEEALQKRLEELIRVIGLN